jgi:uncharacterized RDD family membrane protein YckC
MSTPDPNVHNPYAPPLARVEDLPGAQESVEMASRWQRLGAFLVDALVGLVLYLPVLAATVVHWDPSRSAMVNFANSGSTGFLVTFLLAVVWLIVTIVFVARYGQTIGKRVVGIRVARPGGAKASLGRIFWLRNVVNDVLAAVCGGMIGFVVGLMHLVTPVTLLIGYLYPLIDSLLIFGKAHQCLHDKIADTIVVKSR